MALPPRDTTQLTHRLKRYCAALPFLASLLFSPSAYGAVACNNNSGDPTLINNALSAAASNSTVTITGTCNVSGTTISIPSKGLTLNGAAGATFNGDGGYNVYVASNTTLNGLIFNNARLNVSQNIATNLVVTNCTFQNFTTNSSTVLQSSFLRNSRIDNNTFTNLWVGGYGSTTSNPGDNNLTSAYKNVNGLDNTSISGNVFDQIGGNGISLAFEYVSANTNPQPTPQNVVIANNTFTRVHRDPIEMQGSADGGCPGGCNNLTSANGLEVSGNYAHNPAWPYYNQWYSLVVDNATNTKILNNAFLYDNTAQTCSGFNVPNYEVTGNNGISGNSLHFQGNLGANLPVACSQRNSYVATGTRAPGKNYFQNNQFCGPLSGSSNVSSEVGDPSSIIDQYNYRNTSNCPAGNNLASSNIALAITSANNQSFPSGGNGTWTNSVISNLPIRQMQYFLDGSGTATATQQIQDLNTNFTNDRKWLYHATISTTGLAQGNHTITATATDVSGTSQSVTQNFTVGSGGPPPPTQWSAGYWADDSWSPVSSIEWAGLTHIFHWTIQPNTDGSIQFRCQSALCSQSAFAPYANTLISAAHANGVKVLLSIRPDGDWPSATSSGTLATFVGNLASIVSTYGYDGVDFNWEIAVDNIKYQALLSAMRPAIGNSKLITGNHKDPPAFLIANPSLVDKWGLQSYDDESPGTFTWFNSALGAQQPTNCTYPLRGFDQYTYCNVTVQGFPASKLLLGLAFYGYVMNGATAPRQSPSGVTQTFYNYRDLVPAYSLGSATVDSVSQSPWLGISGGYVTFDNAASLTAKINFVKAHSLGGWFIFQLAADDIAAQTPRHPLLHAVALARGGSGGSVPTISSFTATPATISAGGSSTLAWSTSGATILSINQGVGTVTGTTSATVTPTVTTTYILTATNSVGSASQSVTVTIAAAGTPLISSFTANPGTISAGGVSTLSWVTSGATTLTISPGVGDVTGNTGQTLRTVSPEPGLLFGRIPQPRSSSLTLSQFGDYNSAMGSSPDAGPPLPFLKMIDVLMTSWTGTGADRANSGDFIPSGSVSPYFIKVNGGQTAIIRGNTNYFCYNLASPALQSYFFDTFFPTVYLNHHGPNFLNGVPVDAAHPTFVTMDGFSTDYGYCVAPDGSTPTWDAGYDQTRAQWYIDEDKYFAYAVAHAPEIRLVPHIGSMEDDSYATFAALYKHVPAIEKEPYTIYTLNTVGFQQLYAQFINLARFANDPVAFPPLFTQGGEPATRRIFWGVWLASGDNSLANIENAFAQYAMIRGPSTYWDIVHFDVGQSPIDPALWLPTAQWIGNGTDLPTSVPGTGTAQNSVLVRHFGNSQTGKGGIAFVNMTSSTQTVAVPAGATDFSGQNAVGTSISIPSNRGRVLRLPSGGIIGGGGGSGSGSIGVSPAATTTYVLNACNSKGCTQASTTVTVTSGGGGGGTCGTHPYWRVYGTLSSNGDNDTANPLSASELQFHGTPGGSQIAVGGTALASTTFGGYPASNAFDGDTATLWSAASGANVPQWLGYHFATPVNVSEFTWRDRGDSYPPWQDPRAGTLDYSDDGTTWTSAGSFTFPAWSSGESKTFTLNGGGGACVPVINSFTANPTTITLGASSTLAWNVTGATALAIDQGVGTVTGLNSISVSPTVDTTYTLTASTSTGNATQTVTVHVFIGSGGTSPVITSFTATPGTIAPGAMSQLAWVVTGATTISIDQGVGIVTNLSSTLVSPAVTTTYVLSATNARGTVSQSVTVTVNVGGAPPDILSFTANPPSILSGGASTLKWTTNGGETSLSIDNGIGSVLGTTSFVVHPAITTVYMLTATNASGSVTKVATVTIVAACAM